MLLNVSWCTKYYVFSKNSRYQFCIKLVPTNGILYAIVVKMKKEKANYFYYPSDISQIISI